MQEFQYVFLKKLAHVSLDDDLVFYIPFNINCHIKTMKGDNERLCAMKCHTDMSWIPPSTGFGLGTLWFKVRTTNHSATWTLLCITCQSIEQEHQLNNSNEVVYQTLPIHIAPDKKGYQINIFLISPSYICCGYTQKHLPHPHTKKKKKKKKKKLNSQALPYQS